MKENVKSDNRFLESELLVVRSLVWLQLLSGASAAKKEDWQELVAPRLMTASPVNNISSYFGQNKLIFGNTRSVCKSGIKQEHAGNAQQSRIASVCGYHEAGRIVKPFICTPVSGLGSGCKVHNADCSSRQQWPGTKHPFHEFKIYNCSP